MSRRDPLITERCGTCRQPFRVPASQEGATSCPHCGGPPANVLAAEQPREER